MLPRDTLFHIKLLPYLWTILQLRLFFRVYLLSISLPVSESFHRTILYTAQSIFVYISSIAYYATQMAGLSVRSDDRR